MFKTVTRVCLAVCLFALSILVTGIALADTGLNVIRNGDFSSGMTSWSLNPNLPVGWNPVQNGEASLSPPYPYYNFNGTVLYQNLNITDIANKTFALTCNLTKSSASTGKTVVFYLEYIDTSNATHTLKIGEVDDASITTQTPVSLTSAVLPATARKLVKFVVARENSGSFTVTNISLSADGITVGTVPVITGMSATSGNHGSNLTINGSGFGATSGTVSIGGSAAGVAVQSWSDTAVTIGLQAPARSGLVQLFADYTGSDGALPFRVNSPYLHITLVKEQQSVVRGEIAEFVVRVDFLNGFTASGGVDFDVTGSNGGASPFTGGAAPVITPVPLNRTGGFSVRINTAGLTVGTTYQGEIRTKSPYTEVVPFSLTISSVADIKFYISDSSTNYQKQYITSHTVTKQGGIQGIYVEALDSAGAVLETPVTLSSSSPTQLGVYKVYFYGYSLYALDNGSPNLVATTPDGFSRSLPITITVPAYPKVTGLSIYPSLVTNKMTGSAYPITVSATLTPAITSGYNWGREGLVPTKSGDYSLDSNTGFFSGTITLELENDSYGHQLPPNSGLLGVYVGYNDVLQELPLTVVNDNSYGAIRGGVRALDANSYMYHMLMLEFCDSNGSNCFSKTSKSEPMTPSDLSVLAGLAPGSYKIKYSPMGAGDPVWYPNATSSADAQLVSVVASGENTALQNMLLFHPVPFFSFPVNRTSGGSVTSTPAGMTCDTDSTTCTGTYPTDSWVTLKAVPDNGMVFAGWSGSVCSGTGDCTVTPNDYTSVTATFVADRPSLTVALSGNGSGSVTSSPSGINCPGTCTTPFDSNSTVTLAAAPASDSSFGGWSGDCSGLSSCVLTMDMAKAVTASFTAAPYVKVGIRGFATLQSAYDSIGEDPVIFARDREFSETLQLNRAISVTLQGGRDASFGRSGLHTALKGSLIVSSGTLLVDSLTIR